MRGRGAGVAVSLALGATSLAPALIGDPAARASTHKPCLLRVTTPYTSAHPLRFTLNLQLNTNGDEYVAAAPFKDIVVHDTRTGVHPWTLNAMASSLQGDPGSAINDQNVGLTGLRSRVDPPSHFDNSSRNLSLKSNPPASPAAGIDAIGTLGLGGGKHAVAVAKKGRGTVTLSGSLRVVAPTSTPPGRYTGRLVFTVGCGKAVVPVKPPTHPHPPTHKPTHRPTHKPSTKPTSSVRATTAGRGPSSGAHGGGGSTAFTGFDAAAVGAVGLAAVVLGLIFVRTGRRRYVGRHGPIA
jgi:hypothetical protein